MSKTYQLPRKHSPIPHKAPVKLSSSLPCRSLPLYDVVRLDGAYAVVTAQGGKVQMRGSKAFVMDWIAENDPTKNVEMA